MADPGQIALQLLVTGNASGAIAAMAGFRLASSGAISGIGTNIEALVYGFRNLGSSGGASIGIISTAIAGLGKAALLIGGVALIAITAFAVALGVAASQAAGNFQQSLNRLRTGAGNTTDNLTTLGRSILGVSVATGVLTSGTSGLNAAMYLIDSSGQRGAQSIKTLTAAAQGAQIEMANVVDVTTILTTLQTNFGIHTYTATQYMNGLITAVANGKLTLEELSTAMSPILPIAHSLGISFQDVAGAMAVQTNAGLNARQSATGLQAVFVALENPTKAASSAMRAMGVNSVGVANEMKKSLPGAIQMLIDAALKVGPVGSVPFNRAMMDMIGGGTRTAKTITALTENMKTWEANVAKISASMKLSGSSVMGWQTALSNLNIQVDRGKAALAAFMITLGLQVMPIFQQLIALMLPILTGFLQWVISSGVLKNILQGLLNTLTFLVTTGAAVVSFFNNNQIAMDALKAVVLTLALVITAILIPALVLWIIEMGILAVENIIALWPLYLVLLIIAVAIFAVILVVQHWSQIMSFLGGVFSWLGGIAHIVITAIGAAFSWLGTLALTVWTSVRTAVGTFFSWLGGVAHAGLLDVVNFFTSAWNSIRTGVGAFFSGMGTIVHNGLLAVLNFFISAFQTVGSWFTWLYNHNYIIQYLCDSIRNAFTAVLAWLQNAWNTAITWLVGLWMYLVTSASERWHALTAAVTVIVTAIVTWLMNEWNRFSSWVTGIWNSLKGIASNAWNGLKQAVTNAEDALVTWEMNQWNRFTSWVTGIWNGLKGIASTAWAAVTSVFQNAWGGISNAAHGLWNNVMSFVNGWPAQLYQAGINLIQGLINGITSMVGAVGNAVSGIASKIGSFLGFHSPAKEGPGRELDAWPRAMVTSYSAGLIASIPTMQAALNRLALPIAQTLSGQYSHPGISNSSFALPVSSGQAPIVIQPADVYLDKQKVGQITFTYGAQKVRQVGNVRNR
jgi:TP901 family phage tail tape measure protein